MRTTKTLPENASLLGPGRLADSRGNVRDALSRNDFIVRLNLSKRPSRSLGFVCNRLPHFQKCTDPGIPSLIPDCKRCRRADFISRCAKTGLKSKNPARKRSVLLGLIAASLPLPQQPAPRSLEQPEAVLQLWRLDLISGLKLPGDQLVETRWRAAILTVARG